MPMNELIKFVVNHTVQSACQCPACGNAEPEKRPTHTADMVFFEVAAQNDPNIEEFRRLLQENKAGEFVDVDIFDGGEHSYIEIGGWIGDQGLALRLMGLGTILGLWNLMTPKMMAGFREFAMEMAGAGYVTIMSPK